MKSTELQIAIIGLDTSHAPAFTRMLNDPSNPNHLPGGRVVKAWQGGSKDFELSWSRMGQFTEEVQAQGVTICDTIEEAAEGCDAILLESADGRTHLEQFKKLIPFGIPVFIDKPLTCSLDEAEELVRLAEEHRIPIMSTSSLRFLQGLPEMVATHQGNITGVELRGPCFFEKTQPGYFWYGLHTIEMLFAILGSEFHDLKVSCSDETDRISVRSKEDTAAELELVKENVPFSGTLICGDQRIPLPSSATATEPFYCSLMRRVLTFFRTHQPVVPPAETLSLIAFVEEANRRRDRAAGKKLTELTAAG